MEQLKPLIFDEVLRSKMAVKMRRLACPNAAANVTDVVHNWRSSAHRPAWRHRIVIATHRPYLGARGDAIMPQLIAGPTRIVAAGNKPKQIEEFVGRVNSGNEQLSVARMKSPADWVEPGQRPEFREISVVLSGRLRVEHESGVLDVSAGQAVVCEPGEWVRYSTPEGAEYIAICLPAFSPHTVHRDADG